MSKTHKTSKFEYDFDDMELLTDDDLDERFDGNRDMGAALLPGRKGKQAKSRSYEYRLPHDLKYFDYGSGSDYADY